MPILRRFVKVAGGGDARIVVIPTASELEDTGERYVDIFEELYVETALSLPITTRDHAMDPACVEAIEDATAVFLTGETSFGFRPSSAARRSRRLSGAATPTECTSAARRRVRRSCRST